MRLLSKIGSAVKKIGSRAGSLIKTGAKKIVPIVLGVASKGSQILSHLPGTIGTVASLANKGITAVKNVIDGIPNLKARDTLNNVVNRGQSAVNNAQNTATNISNRLNTTAQPILRGVGQVGQTAMKLAN